MNKTGFFFEDFAPGKKFYTSSRTVTEADHVNFTTSFGFFEPLFMDRSFVSANSPYRQPVIPGAMTFSLAEGLTILSGILHKTGMAFLGVELEVLKPVHFGDTLRVVIEVIDLRTTKKPGRGIVTFRHDVKNQNESDVMVYTIKRMIRKR